MKKVLDKELEKAIAGIIKGNPKNSATEIVAFFKELQDASGLKVCQNVTNTDVAYRRI